MLRLKSSLIAAFVLTGALLWSTGMLSDVGQGLKLLTSADAWQAGLDQQIAARGFAGAALMTPTSFEESPGLKNQPMASAVYIVSGGCRAKSGWGIFEIEADLCYRLSGSEIQL